jgi:hypothetical protein
MLGAQEKAACGGGQVFESNVELGGAEEDRRNLLSCCL